MNVLACSFRFYVWVLSILCSQCACSHSGQQPGRYLKLPECIASVVVLPHIKEKINLYPNTDLLVGVGFPVEMTITAPKPNRRPPIVVRPPAFLPAFLPVRQTATNRVAHGQTVAHWPEINDLTVVQRRRVARSNEIPPLNILQRLQLYKSISISMSRLGIPGDSCVRRAICEAAMTPQAQDEILIGELVTVVLRVPNNSFPEMNEFNEARRTGETSRDCSKYFDCPISIFRTALMFG